MHLKIENDLVRKNIEIFKIILRRAIHAHEKTLQEKTTQQFEAFVSRKNGEIRFADLSPESLDKKEWSLVSFHFSLTGSDEESFSVSVTDKGAKELILTEFDSKATSALQETLKTIQFISRFLPRLQTLTSVLQEFSLMNLDSFLHDLSGKDLIHEAWHSLTREECEDVLDDKQEGVFLFRKDPYTALMEEDLSKEHAEEVQCITLSYKAGKDKIKEMTLIRRECGWSVYDNDPTLKGTLYPSPGSLLESFKSLLKTPLLQIV